MMPASDQGVLDDRYRVIPRSLIFITKGDNVLLLRGAHAKRLWADRYNGIGGHIEKGEDIFSAAKRELVEETGLSIPELLLCGLVMVDVNPTTGMCIFVFRGEYADGRIIPSCEGFLEWIPFAKILDYPLVEDLRTILPMVLSRKPTDPPFSALYSYDSENKLKMEFG
ncbi:MAG: NUDIX domain-containing protein [Anaerolineaceae bacterium]|nr:NUDIX domain-containing protein [Anaerolineaceae bacterium]